MHVLGGEHMEITVTEEVKNSHIPINSILEFHSRIGFMSDHPQEIPILKNYLIMIIEFRTLVSTFERQMYNKLSFLHRVCCSFSDIKWNTDSLV